MRSAFLLKQSKMMQILFDLFDTSIAELISCVGMEFMMFVVATAAYILLVGDGKGALSLFKANKSCFGANLESPKLNGVSQ